MKHWEAARFRFSFLITLKHHSCLSSILVAKFQGNQGPVSLRLMTSQFKDIITHTQKYKTVKCILCGVWVQNKAYGLLCFPLLWLYYNSWSLMCFMYPYLLVLIHRHWGNYMAALPERTRGRPWGRQRVRIRSIEKTWGWEFYPAAQNFRNRMLFWNTHIFKTI